MRSLARRVKSLESKNGIGSPLIVIMKMKMDMEQLTPEEEALFEADENRHIREAEARATGLMVLMLRRDRERLAELKEGSIGETRRPGLPPPIV
jgi:hypothetical protein